MNLTICLKGSYKRLSKPKNYVIKNLSNIILICPEYKNIRYVGIIDIDMDDKNIKNGKESLLNNEPAKVMNKTEIMNILTKEKFKNEKDMINRVKSIENAYNIGKEMFNVLDNCEKILYFTGGKGYRLIWFDKDLYLNVNNLSNRSETFKKYILNYFKNKGLSLDSKWIDKNIYDFNKGTKSDMYPHSTTKYWPGKYLTKEDKKLSKSLTQLWSKIFDTLEIFVNTQNTLKILDNNDKLNINLINENNINNEDNEDNINNEDDINNENYINNEDDINNDKNVNFNAFIEDEICKNYYGEYYKKIIKENFISYNLKSKLCRIANREHSSNRTYAVFDTNKKIHYQKCFDKEECGEKKSEKISYNNLIIRDLEKESIMNYINNNLNKLFPNINFDKINEIKKMITEDEIKYFITFYHNNNICPLFNQKHKIENCLLYLILTKLGSMFKCNQNECVNNGTYPTNLVPIPDEISKVIFNITVNNNINNINNYNTKYNNSNNNLNNNYNISTGEEPIYVRIGFEKDVDKLIIFENDKEKNDIFIQSLEGYHYDMAKMVYHDNKNIVKCVDPDGFKNVWYEFIGNRWHIGSTKIKHYISNDYVINIRKAINLYNIILDIDDNEKKRKIKSLENLIGNCKISSFKKNIISECREFFYDRNFLRKLDTNIYLIGFDNGIYDLENLEFRQGKPEDYVTKSTKYNFIIDKTEYYEHTVNFIKSLFENEEEIYYIEKFLGLCISGETESLFHMFCGSGSNGKSLLGSLLESTLGEYFAAVKSSLLTSKRNNSQSHDSDIMGLQGCRLLYLQEPENGNNSKINGSVIKWLTGNDIIRGRKAHSPDEFEFSPQFKIVLCCNKMPKMDEIDGGVKRRCRCIKFNYKFVKNPNNKYEKNGDESIKYNIKKWNSNFMLYLIECYKKYKNDGLEMTKNIEEYTKEYEEENKNDDTVYLFMNDQTIRSDGDSISTKILFNKYLLWCSDNNIKNKIDNFINFCRKLNKNNYETNRIKNNKERINLVKNIKLLS
jgi:P4 family phage/plasmid primase-like protien